MRFAKVGTLVVSHNESGHEELLALLDRYRAALKVSKPREEDKPDPKEVLTRYYRLPSPIAAGLAKALPKLVAPDSWKSAERPDATGTILMLPSESEVTYKEGKEPLVVEQSVLIIVQTRENHEAIVDRIAKIRHGDHEPLNQGFGGGMGGFGGGAFSVEETQ